MTGPVALPPWRASHAERDHALVVLREAAVAGRLSDDSFEMRVDLVLRARSRDELRSVVQDLPSRGLGAVVERWVVAVADLEGRLRAALETPRLPRLAVPRDRTRSHVLGRHPAADLVVSDPTVSRWHARLDPDPAGGWRLADLGSTNGTLVNGWRVLDPMAVRAGDRVTFGLVTVVLSRR